MLWILAETEKGKLEPKLKFRTSFWKWSMQWHAHTATIPEIQRKIHFCGKFGACFREIFVHMCMDVCVSDWLRAWEMNLRNVVRLLLGVSAAAALLPTLRRLWCQLKNWLPFGLQHGRLCCLPADLQPNRDLPGWLAGWMDGSSWVASSRFSLLFSFGGKNL